MKAWIKSYIWWVGTWAPWRPGFMRHRQGAFDRCPDCGKRMFLSAHLNCIPF